MSFKSYTNKIEKRKILANKIFESTSVNPTEIDTNIVNFFNNEFNTTFRFVKVGIYKNESFGTIDGALYISDNKSAIRINWLDKNLIGLSYWITYNTNYIDYEFEFTSEDPISDLKKNLPAITSYLKNSIDTEEDVEVKSGTFDVYSYTDENEIIVDHNDCGATIDEIFNTTNDNTKLKNLKSMVKSIAKKLNKSLLVMGVDKNGNTSNNIKTMLDNNGLSVSDDYIIRTCQADNDVLLKTLHDFSDKVIIFDNADNMILKSDEVSKTTRQLLLPTTSKTFTYKSKDKDGNENTESFTFNGSVILITNITKNRLRNKDKEIISKCMSINMKEDNEDTLTKMKNSIDEIHIYKASSIGGEAKEVKDKSTLEDVIDFMISNDFIYNPRNKTNSFTFEQLQNIFLIAKSGNKNWKFIALDLI